MILTIPSTHLTTSDYHKVTVRLGAKFGVIASDDLHHSRNACFRHGQTIGFVLIANLVLFEDGVECEFSHSTSV